jgi:hypothetical protein
LQNAAVLVVEGLLRRADADQLRYVTSHFLHRPPSPALGAANLCRLTVRTVPTRRPLDKAAIKSGNTQFTIFAVRECRIAAAERIAKRPKTPETPNPVHNRSGRGKKQSIAASPARIHKTAGKLQLIRKR